MKATRTLAALAAAILLLPALPVAANTTPATLTNYTLGAGYAISEDHTLYTWNETQKPQAALENIRSVADTQTGSKLLIDTQNTLYEQTVDGLQKLAENRGHIVTYDALFEAVWGQDYFGGENTLGVHIRHLREKIEDNASKPRYLLTVRGIGYKLAGEDAP